MKKLLVGTALLLIATSAHAQIATIYPPPAQNDHSCWADALRAYPDSDHSQDRREYAAACEENEVRRNNLLDEARRKYALDCARPDESSLTRHDCYINRDLRRWYQQLQPASQRHLLASWRGRSVEEMMIWFPQHRCWVYF